MTPMCTVVFDVNETLLDLSALDPHFTRVFGDSSARSTWFAALLQMALVSTIVGASNTLTFAQIGGMALERVAAMRGATLSREDIDAIATGMRTLPPHPEAHEALNLLHDHGIRTAALTNSAQRDAEQQLENAGLAGSFSTILSVEPTGTFKPSVDVYRRAAHELGVGADQLWMVAVHDWDIQGAMNAGWRGAFVNRGSVTFAQYAPPPHVTGRDLVEVARAILAAPQVPSPPSAS